MRLRWRIDQRHTHWISETWNDGRSAETVNSTLNSLSRKQRREFVYELATSFRLRLVDQPRFDVTVQESMAEKHAEVVDARFCLEGKIRLNHRVDSRARTRNPARAEFLNECFQNAITAISTHQCEDRCVAHQVRRKFDLVVGGEIVLGVIGRNYAFNIGI